MNIQHSTGRQTRQQKYPPLLGLLLALSINLSSWAQTVSPDSINGYWVMPDGSALLEIYRADDGYAVRITALREQHFTVADGSSKRLIPGEIRRDIHNPKAALRQRSLLGLNIASGLKFDNERWSGGSIYDPGSGRSYRCHLQLAQGGFLQVRGYLGISLLGRTMYWQRAEDFKSRVTNMLQAVPVNIVGPLSHENPAQVVTMSQQPTH